MTDVYKRNVEIFMENREIALSLYDKETEHMVETTHVFKNPLKLDLYSSEGAMNISFWETDTISAVFRLLKKGHRVCALNFADAVTPGGLVFVGEKTQEEGICRCSNLYEGLIKEECMLNYYDYNRSLNNSIFSDRVIYSRDVLLLRKATDYSFIEPPMKFDVVTCPAPVAFGLDRQIYENTVEKRIRGILAVVARHDCSALVLGAWGCGAFCGDATFTGETFGTCLSEYPYFDEVNFSVVPTKHTEVTDSSNFEKLKNGFYSTYMKG